MHLIKLERLVTVAVSKRLNSCYNKHAPQLMDEHDGWLILI